MNPSSIHIHHQRNLESLNRISKKYAQVLILHWNCFPLHHHHLISFTLLNARLCFILLNCLICIYGGVCHFPFSFSKLMGSFIQDTNSNFFWIGDANSIYKDINAKKKKKRKKERMDGHLICWINFLVMVKDFSNYQRKNH